MKQKIKWNYEGNLGSKVNLTTPYKTIKSAKKWLRIARKKKYYPQWKDLSVVKTYGGYRVAGKLRK